MKILLATSKAIPKGGGIASYNQELINLLSKDHEIYLLTDSPEYNVSGYQETYSTYGHYINDIEYCKRLIQNINNANYDCIINSASAFIPVIIPFLKSKSISVSHFVNGLHALNAGYNADYHNIIIALSEYGKNYLNQKFKITNTHKIHVIYNFVKAKEYDNLSKTRNSILRIVYPGGTSISKSMDVVQDVVYKLQQSDLKFEFYWLGGTNLPVANYSLLGLKDTIDLFNKDPRIKITGLLSRQDSVDIISSANIFLLPSRLEGCPMTLLEAMRAGCIAIISDAKHGSYEIISKTHAGIITKQGSGSDIYNKILDIITNHEKYKDLYFKSREVIKLKLSEEIWRKQMNNILSNIIKTDKKYIPLNDLELSNSIKKYTRLRKIELLKSKFKSIFYRIKIDFTYIFNKIRF